MISLFRSRLKRQMSRYLEYEEETIENNMANTY